MKYPVDVLEAMTERNKKSSVWNEDTKEWGEIARLIREGQQLRKAKNLPLSDEDQEIKNIKRKYLELQSAAKVARWAFDNIPGFSISLEKAKKRTEWIIDHESGGETDIDAACKKIRRAKRRGVGVDPYMIDRAEKRAERAAAAVTGGKED